MCVYRLYLARRRVTARRRRGGHADAVTREGNKKEGWPHHTHATRPRRDTALTSRDSSVSTESSTSSPSAISSLALLGCDVAARRRGGGAGARALAQANCSLSDDGVLGGYGRISPTDITGSHAYLDALYALRRPPMGRARAADVGAGIGRVAKGLLLPRYARVDMLEQSARLLEVRTTVTAATPPRRASSSRRMHHRVITHRRSSRRGCSRLWREPPRRSTARRRHTPRIVTRDAACHHHTRLRLCSSGRHTRGRRLDGR